jgi:hypothetical protein
VAKVQEPGLLAARRGGVAGALIARAETRRRSAAERGRITLAGRSIETRYGLFSPRSAIIRSMQDDDYFPFSALRARIAELATQGGHEDREAAAWELADRLARLGGESFHPHRIRPRQRYPLIEAT